MYRVRFGVLGPDSLDARLHLRCLSTASGLSEQEGVVLQALSHIRVLLVERLLSNI